MRHLQLRLIRVAALLILSNSPSGGTVLAEDQPSTIEKAYARTKSASTPRDYTEVIQLCQQAQAEDLPQKDKDYVQRLLGWTYNRRGEARTELAAAAVKDGDDQRAAELDAQALVDFEAAVKQDATRWKPFHNRGVSYALAGKYEEAIADFSRAISLNSDYANAWFNRGEIRYERGQLAEAVRDYTQAIQLSQRQDAGAYTSRGHAYFRLKNFRQSLNDYNRAVQLTPSSPHGYANRGDANQSLGMWEQAARDFRRAIELDSGFARAYQSAAWLMATCPDSRYRDGKLAVEAARRAVQLPGEKDHRYLDTLAAALANAGQFDEAKSTLADAIKIAPEANVEALQKRLVLYAGGEPYRQDRDQTAGSRGP